jgi:hypothetical protein
MIVDKQIYTPYLQLVSLISYYAESQTPRGISLVLPEQRLALRLQIMATIGCAPTGMFGLAPPGAERMPAMWSSAGPTPLMPSE